MHASPRLHGEQRGQDQSPLSSSLDRWTIAEECTLPQQHDRHTQPKWEKKKSVSLAVVCRFSYSVCIPPPFFFFLPLCLCLSRSPVLVSVSVFIALSTVFHSLNSPDNSPLSHSVLLVLFLPNWSFQLCIFSSKSPSALM